VFRLDQLKRLNPFNKPPAPYTFIQNDITNDCNIRCPFCNSDFSNIDKTIFMPKTTFEKVLKLLSLGHLTFYFSCGYEPTIHPQFIEFLEMIPDKFKGKTLFTTNLVKTLPDDTIDRLSRLKISHINISVESFDPVIYESLRKGAKFASFINNLQRLTAAFAKNPHAPKLRYIAMVLKANLHDLPQTLEACYKKYLAQEFEFRGTHNKPIGDWQKQNFVTPQEWAKLERDLEPSPYQYRILRFEDDADKKKTRKYIRVNAKGEVAASITGVRKTYDLNTIDDPYPFFRDLAL